MHLAKYFIRTWYKNVCFSKQACLGTHQVVQHKFVLLELASLDWIPWINLCLSAWCVHSPQQLVEAPSSEPRMAQTGLRLQQHRFPGEARVGQYALPSVGGRGWPWTAAWPLRSSDLPHCCTRKACGSVCSADVAIVALKALCDCTCTSFNSCFGLCGWTFNTWNTWDEHYENFFLKLEKLEDYFYFQVPL